MSFLRATSSVLAGLVVLAGCGQPGGGSSLTITGRIGAGVKQAPLRPRGPELTSIQQALHTSEGPVASVLGYRGFGLAERATVDSSGHFALPVDRRQPVGLVFLDAADAVVGTLALEGGVAALPVSLTPDGVSGVALADLSFDGGVATPATDPTAQGGVLALTPTEQAAWAQQSALFTTLVRNLDMDHDDALDVLSPRRYWMMFGATYRGGTATSTPPDAGASYALNDFRLSFSDRQAVVLSPSPTLELPGGATLTQVHEELRWAGDPDGSQLPTYVFTSPSGQAFAAGAWHLTYGQPSRQLLFDVAVPLENQAHVVAGDLWWEQVDATHLRLHWTWSLAGGGAVAAGVDLSRLVSLVICDVRFADGASAHKDSQDPTVTAFTMDLQGHQVSDVVGVGVTSRDLFGNEYAVGYDVP